VFSDKTGTLTSNEMQLRQIAIEGTSYGSASYRYHYTTSVWLAPAGLSI